MQANVTPHIVRTTAELGGFIRSKRKEAGYTSLESTAKACLVGKRFLSECERGKETAEIGKIFNVLHGLGLTLAVVQQEPDAMPSAQESFKPLSQRLELDFPYDWSNPAMDESVFIHQVLEKGRFMDVLRLAKHYGIDRIDTAAQAFVETPNWLRLGQIINRIRAGKARITG